MIVSVASWLRLGKNKPSKHISIGSLGRVPDPNRTEKKEFESYFSHNSIIIPIQVHVEEIYVNNILKERIVNIRDIRLPVSNVFSYTEVSHEKNPFRLIYTDKKIEHNNHWVRVFGKDDLIKQIKKNNEFLNNIEYIKNNK
jgi:hypothetical protein